MGGLAANRGVQEGGGSAAGAKDTAYVQGFGGSCSSRPLWHRQAAGANNVLKSPKPLP